MMERQRSIEEAIAALKFLRRVEEEPSPENLRALDALIDPDCSVIGTGGDSFYQSKAEFMADMTTHLQAAGQEPFEVADEAYSGKMLGQDLCMVCSRLHIRERKPEQRMALEMDVRLTALCRWQGETLRITHLHRSVPTVSLQSEGSRPKSMVQVTREALDRSWLLERERERTKTMLQGVNMMIWEYCPDRGGRVEMLSSSKEFEPFDCCSIEEFSQSNIILPEYRQPLLELYRKIGEGEPSAELDIQVWDKNSQLRWMHVELNRVTTAEGEIVIGSGADVTQTVEAQRKLEKEIRLQQTLEVSNLVAKAHYNLSQNQVVRYWSRPGYDASYRDCTVYEQQAAAIGRKAANELQRRALAQMLDRGRLLQRLEQGVTEETLEYQRLYANGRKMWVRNTIKLFSDPATGEGMAFLYAYDVDEEKKQEILYQRLTDSLYEYVAYVDLQQDTYHIYITGGCEYGLPQQPTGSYSQSYPQSVQGCVVAEEQPTMLETLSPAGIRQHLQEQEKYQCLSHMRQPDGRLRTKRTTLSYMDREEQIVLIAREDVTEQQQRENERAETLVHALKAAKQANQAKSEFLSRMSHELRTPMNAIIGLSVLAASDTHDPAAMEDALGKIGLSARYLLSLINDILEMSRIESGRMTLNEEDFRFDELISGVNTIIYGQCSDKGVDYDAITKGFTEPVYVGDATKLQQILVNVLGNAVKFTPAGGKVTLMIEQVARTRSKATLRFVCSDTGVGIEEGFLPSIFDPFSQEKSSFTSTATGTGLGLAITKSMVEMMNGSIQVRSIKNMGSVFTIEVELGVSEQSRQRMERLSAMNLSKLSALVVDDDVVVCQSTEGILRSMGLQAEWVDSGERAVERVAECRRQKKNFDAIFIDWKMPVMDGIETTRQIRRIVGPEVTIVIMTAYDRTAIEGQARDAGVDLFMEKPLFQSSIVSTLEKIFLTQKAEETPQPKQEYDFTGRCVLLAEDNELNAEIARRLLEKTGAEVTLAGNGLEALELYTTAPVGHYDAILMDIRMPVMDGLTTAQNIRSLKKAGSKTIPIIAMTANAFDEDIKQSLAHGMNVHLTKPIDPKVLYSTLDGVFKKQSQTDPPLR